MESSNKSTIITECETVPNSFSKFPNDEVIKESIDNTLQNDVRKPFQEMSAEMKKVLFQRQIGVIENLNKKYKITPTHTSALSEGKDQHEQETEV